MAGDESATGGGPSSSMTPAVVTNRPSLRAIEYRIGTYATFRRAMLEQIARWRRLPDDADLLAAAGVAVVPGQPLGAWTTRSADDFGIAFVEMWAYIGDILTFYQERIANEAYLRTSMQPPSTSKLVALIGYRPGPGRAAVAYLAFETERDATVELAAGLRVQSVPGQDEKPQKFETLGALTAYSSLNELRPRTLVRQVLPRGATRAVLAGTGHLVSIGDWIAIAGEDRRKDPGSERWDVRQVVEVAEDEDAGTTTISWLEGLGSARRPGRAAVEPDEHPEFWVFRGQAWPFGYNAPDLRLFQRPAKGDETLPAGAAGGKEPPPEDDPLADVPDAATAYLPEKPTQPTQLYLDTVYPGIVEGGWVALVTSQIDTTAKPELTGYDEYIELYPVKASVDTAHANYLLAGKSTRVTLDAISPEQFEARKATAPVAVKTRLDEFAGEPPEHIEFFPVRGTIVLVGAERIPFAEVELGHSALAAAASTREPVQGSSLELDGLYPDLHRGRTLLVTGMRLDSTGQAIGVGAEAVVVATVPTTTDGHTTIVVAPSLASSYERATVVIYGNVALASHGESVRNEILGDGDASREFQSLGVKKAPITYVPEPGAPGGVASTLQVRVDGVRWTEVPELYGRPGDARIYVARRDAAGATRIQAGDGRRGARITTGRGNVSADYRVGLGPDGNVDAGSLRTLLTKPLGLKRVTNPAAAAGGTEAEDPAAVKRTAPGTVRTFGRIVSIRDFEDAAREFVGVAKARASLVWKGESRVIDLVVAGDRGAEIDVVESGLRADLDARRDPHQPLDVRSYERRPITVRLSVAVDPAYVASAVRRDADAALRALLAFDAVELGEGVGLSDIHRAIQRVDGVMSVDVDEFQFKAPPPAGATPPEPVVEPRLLVKPDELIWVEDPDDLRVTVAGTAGAAA